MAHRDTGDAMGNRRSGFTLIEMLLVVVIIGILVAFAAPKIDITRYRVNSAIQVLGTTMLTAQRQAMTQQHDVIVTFDTTQGLLRLHEDRNNDGDVDTGEHVRPVSIGEDVSFGRGSAPAQSMGNGPITFVRRISGRPALVFHRDGSASEVGGFYVTSLRDARDGGRPTDARSVSVVRATGRASWSRYTNDGWVAIF